MAVRLRRSSLSRSRAEASTPSIASEVGVEIVNRSLGGETVIVSVTCEDGHTIIGRNTSVELGPDLPRITLKLAGGLPLELAFGTIASIRMLP